MFYTKEVHICIHTSIKVTKQRQISVTTYCAHITQFIVASKSFAYTELPIEQDHFTHC